ncbi:MAG: Gfo/Idh/MocA family protein [Frankiaceae bacterium]
MSPAGEPLARQPEELRVAVLGYGLAGRVFHAGLIRATPGLRVATVVTSNPDRRAAAEADDPAVTVLASPDELWAQAAGHDLVDLVVVATPNASHVPLALAGLGSGLPVVVDKPMALTSADGRRLRDAATEAGLLLTVFHNRRWDSDTLTVRRMLSAGADGIGSVFRFESRFERFRPDVDAGAWKEQPGAEAGGGVLLDLGTHVVDSAIWLFGQPDSVYAEVDVRRPGARVDDDVFIAMTHPGGVRSHLVASAVAGDPGPRVRLRGLDGALTIPRVDSQEERLRAGDRADAPGWGAEPPGRWGYLTTRAGTRRLEPERGRYPAFYAGVRDCLQDGAPPPVDSADAVAVLDVLDAARHSSQTKSVVPLPFTG